MSYLGSKGASGAFQAIISRMPPHDTYIESHLGSGTVLKRKPGAARSIGIDRDPDVIKAFDHASNVELVCDDAIVFLSEFDFDNAGRVLIYADPPYLLSTRTSDKRYKFEYTDRDHRKLLEFLKSLPADVILSGYPSKMYDDELKGWRAETFQVMTRGGPRTEKLWMNFNSESVHWATFAGKNRTHRQQIKRKAARWRANYLNLTEGEKLAVLAELLDTHSE